MLVPEEPAMMTSVPKYVFSVCAILFFFLFDKGFPSGVFFLLLIPRPSTPTIIRHAPPIFLGRSLPHSEPIRTPTSQMPNPEEKVVCTFHGAVYTCQTGQSKGWHMLSEGYVPVYVVHSEYTPQMPFKLVAATSAQDGPGVAPCLIFNISMEVRGRRTKTTFLQWHLKGSSDQTNYGLQLVNEEQAVKVSHLLEWNSRDWW